jgi:hypothetical protein
MVCLPPQRASKKEKEKTTSTGGWIGATLSPELEKIRPGPRLEKQLSAQISHGKSKAEEDSKWENDGNRTRSVPSVLGTRPKRTETKQKSVLMVAANRQPCAHKLKVIKRINRSAARDKPSTKSHSWENKLKARTLLQGMVAAAKILGNKGATLAWALETTTGKWKSKEKTGRCSRLIPENKNETSALETASPHKLQNSKMFININKVHNWFTEVSVIPPSFDWKSTQVLN